MFRNINLTIRNLRRSGVYSVINIVGLAMSLATCVFIVLWVQDEKSYDRFHKDAENLYMAYLHFESDGRIQYLQTVPGLLAYSAKEDFAAADDFCRLSVRTNQNLEYEDVNSSSISIFTADPNFFDFFNFPVVRGNRDYLFRNPNDAVISERLAKELFQNEDPVGKIIRLVGADGGDEEYAPKYEP